MFLMQWKLEVCKSYNVNGEETNEIPFQMMRSKMEPIYKKFTGWKTDITSIKNFDNLPPEMKAYINYINKYWSSGKIYFKWPGQ